MSDITIDKLRRVAKMLDKPAVESNSVRVTPELYQWLKDAGMPVGQDELAELHYTGRTGDQWAVGHDGGPIELAREPRFTVSDRHISKGPKPRNPRRPRKRR